jgi:hypothetical protein
MFSWQFTGVGLLVEVNKLDTSQRKEYANMMKFGSKGENGE